MNFFLLFKKFHSIQRINRGQVDAPSIRITKSHGVEGLEMPVAKGKICFDRFTRDVTEMQIAGR